ncbi:MAG: dihydrolipoamide acetyltransferase family protein [Flavobacteriales bacterium]
MAKVELIMPKMGESVAEATITNWVKSVGDTIEVDETVLEIATDKVDSEVPASDSGVLVEILFDVDDVVEVGQTIAYIETDAAEASTSAPAATETSAPVQELEQSINTTVEEHSSTEINSKESPSGKFLSPLVRSIAGEEGISMDELDTITGTGMEGRITKHDILQYVSDKKAGKVSVAKPAPVAASKPAPAKSAPKASAPAKEIKAPSVPVGPNDEIIEMDRMRKLIADHMVMSKHVSPHVTSFVEADVTDMVNWRNGVKNDFKKREGQNITFTPLFIEAVVKAIKDYPMINVSVDGHKIIKHNDINVGMATALPSGNLIVPVIKNADEKSLLGITKSVNGLANKARANKLAPDDISGGTFTLTNVGGFGNVMGTPIINQPQVAILAVGTITKKPAVLETEHGDVIAIRQKMFLSLSYDHRVVDGSLGGMFLRRVADYLEQFDTSRTV